MPITFIFHDSLETSVVTTEVPVTQSADGLAPAVDRVLYLWSDEWPQRLQAESNPGVDQIVFSVADSASGSGVQAAHVKLALTAGGLDSATFGAPLNVGVEILSDNAPLAIYLRIDTPALTAGVYSELTLTSNSVIETVVV